jgi:hypothetical protein
MQLSEFKVGRTFRCGDQQWRCTDIGTWTVVAISIDSVAVPACSQDPGGDAGAVR